MGEHQRHLRRHCPLRLTTYRVVVVGVSVIVKVTTPGLSARDGALGTPIQAPSAFRHFCVVHGLQAISEAQVQSVEIESNALAY